ncbi:MAG: hypothetical protein ACI9EF_002260 [Pseudohongiellaceae bacterium]|jgi:hypothetical protein
MTFPLVSLVLMPLALALVPCVSQTSAQTARPVAASLTPAAVHVRLNEFLAVNETGATDERGEHEPWVELFNRKTVQVDVGGMHLTNEVSDPTRWTIPPNTLIPANSAIMIWLDGETVQGPLHASFSLDPAKGSLWLFDLDGATLVNSFNYQVQVADVSTGRLLDGGFWVTLLDPSPGQSNLVSACGNRRYGALETEKQKLQFELQSPAVLGQQATFQLVNAVDNTPALLYIALAPAYIQLPGFASVLLVELQFPTVPFMTNELGELSFTLNIPNNTNFEGLTIYMQMLQPFGGYPGSNAVAFKLCANE